MMKSELAVNQEMNIVNKGVMKEGNRQRRVIVKQRGNERGL